MVLLPEWGFPSKTMVTFHFWQLVVHNVIQGCYHVMKVEVPCLDPWNLRILMSQWQCSTVNFQPFSCPEHIQRSFPLYCNTMVYPQICTRHLPQKKSATWWLKPLKLPSEKIPTDLKAALSNLTYQAPSDFEGFGLAKVIWPNKNKQLSSMSRKNLGGCCETLGLVVCLFVCLFVCHVMSCHLMSCHVTSHHVMLCYVMLSYVMLCCVMSCYLSMLCYVFHVMLC